MDKFETVHFNLTSSAIELTCPCPASLGIISWHSCPIHKHTNSEVISCNCIMWSGQYLQLYEIALMNNQLQQACFGQLSVLYEWTAVKSVCGRGSTRICVYHETHCRCGSRTCVDIGQTEPRNLFSENFVDSYPRNLSSAKLRR